MARHKEKDDEAGGEGLGKLLTRKRLWRDSTGAIVSKRRPEHDKERKRSGPSDSDASPNRAGRHQNHPNLNQTLASRTQKPAPPSPPRSLEPISNGSAFIQGPLASVEGSLLPPGVDDQWPMPNPIDEMPFEDAGFDSFEFLCNAHWGAQPISGGVNSDMPYDNMFAPDTGTMRFFSLCLPILTSSQQVHLTCLSPRPTTFLGCLETRLGLHQTGKAVRLCQITLPKIPVGLELQNTILCQVHIMTIVTHAFSKGTTPSPLTTESNLITPYRQLAKKVLVPPRTQILQI